MVSFLVDALVFLLLGTLEVAAIDQWLGDTDSHIQYTPSELHPPNGCTDETDSSCEGRWWSFGDGDTYREAYMRTWGKGTSMELPFQGSGIIVKGIYDSNGARAFATVDDGHKAHLDFTSSTGRQLNETVYAVDGLATDVPHVLAIWYDDTSYGDATAGRRFVNLDAFIVSFPDTLSGPFPDFSVVVSPTPTTSSAPVKTADPSSTTDPATTTLTASSPTTTTPTVSSPTATTSSAFSPSSSHRSSTTMAIAVAVPLSALALGVTLLGWLALRAHSRRLRQQQIQGHAPAQHDAALTPYWGQAVDPITPLSSEGKARTGHSSTAGMLKMLDDGSFSYPPLSHQPASVVPPPTYSSPKES